MRLVSFRRGDGTSFGCVEGDEILDFGPSQPAGTTLRDCLPGGLPLFRALVDAVSRDDRLPFDRSLLLAPIPNARKYLGLGGNYASHARQAEAAGIVRGASQTWFNKQVTSINAPYGDIDRPIISDQLDYEGELGVVIARDCRHVRGEEAWQHVAGYVVCNDVSVRDWQLRSPTHTLGKSFDSHGPFGPWIVTPDEIANPHRLELSVHVNGELRQHANTSEMQARVPDFFEELTTAFTLQAGDILATGTPAGVGGLMQPPRYLEPGDVVRVEIEKIGFIENRVVSERRPERR